MLTKSANFNCVDVNLYVETSMVTLISSDHAEGEKDHSLLNGYKCRLQVNICSPSPAMVTSPNK